MERRQFLKQLRGKTIRTAVATRQETADSCAFGTFELHFTDGSHFSLQLRAMPSVEAVLFKDAKDDDPSEAELVKP